MNKKQVSIAIVDDHSLMRQFCCFRLSRLGYSVAMEAENGKHLLDQLACSPLPDICLLDINMPVMNGFETAQHLKKNWPSIKVIFHSMQDNFTYIQKALQLGAYGYVTKDGPLEDLEKALLKGSQHI